MTAGPQSDISVQRNKRIIFRWFLRFLFACILLLVGAELFARCYLHLGDPPLSMADPEIEYMFKPNQTVNRFGNIIHYNQWSMKSDDFPKTKTDPNEFRVLVIGDSVVNGGAQTANSQTATSLLQHFLREKLKRHGFVGNISAGSWGPPNQLAYLRRFGLFDADIIFLVISSHDYADAPTFEPIVGIHPGFPQYRPPFALYEAVTRYLPNYIPALRQESGDPMPSVVLTQNEIDICQRSIRDMIDIARSKQIPFVVIQHLQRSELGCSESIGHRINRETATEAGVVVVDTNEIYQDAIKTGQHLYRDDIHINIDGQALLAKILERYTLKEMAAATQIGTQPTKR